MTEPAEVTLRPAVADDAATIMQLVVRNQLNPLDLRWQNFTVATDAGGRVVGCGQIRPHGNIDELASLVVADDWQGRGLSSQLMQALLARGKRPLWLMCESPLVRYYQRFGFAEVNAPLALPDYFRVIFGITRVAFLPMFMLRGTYVAFMVLRT